LVPAAEPLDPKIEKQDWEGRIGYYFVPKVDGPAYNAGGDAISNITSTTIKNDQRGAGMTRKYNGVVDIGAIERQPPNTAPTCQVQKYHRSGGKLLSIHAQTIAH
jgi:hypothetical protein